RAICALRGAALVELADVLEALDLAVAHRRREPLSDKPEQVQELASRAAEQLAQIQATTPTETAEAARGEATHQEGASGGESNEGWTTAEARESPSTEAVEVEPDTVIQLRTFAVKKLDLPRERQARRAAGKRTSTKSETKRGRYVRSSQTEKVTDVAFDATVRAAAPHQLRRRLATPDAPNQLQLESQDLRQKVRERKTGNLIVFVVDASASMDAERTASQIKQEGIRAMVIDSTRDFSSQPGYPRNRVTSLYGAYAFNVCGDLAERLGGRYYGLFDLSQSAIVDSVQREMLRTGS